MMCFRAVLQLYMYLSSVSDRVYRTEHKACSTHMGIVSDDRCSTEIYVRVESASLVSTPYSSAHGNIFSEVV